MKTYLLQYFTHILCSIITEKPIKSSWSSSQRVKYNFLPAVCVHIHMLYIARQQILINEVLPKSPQNLNAARKPLVV